jgi:hypothetical protein
MKTHERLALELGVSPSTIIRDGQFAKAVDYLTELLGKPFQNRLLTRQIDPRLTQQDVIALAKLPPELLRGRSDAELKQLAGRAKPPVPSAGLADAKRAYTRLPPTEQRTFVLWLAAKLRKPAPRFAPGCVPGGSVDTLDFGDKRPTQGRLRGLCGV